MKRISKHISYRESTTSQTATRRGIENSPTQNALVNMKRLANEVFEPLRSHINEPIIISSFFRSVTLNAAIGGSGTSQHCSGEAMDIIYYGKHTNADMFNYIKDNLEFDQLIWEYGDLIEPRWVHVSLDATLNRKQVLRVERKEGKAVYTLIN